MIDIGGTNVKVMVSGHDEMRKAPSNREMTAEQMVDAVKKLIPDWEFDCVSLGFPGLVRNGRLVREPLNLGGSWYWFAFFEEAFRCPVRIINDAALQALAAYEGGRMLFIGFGTSIGATLVADGVIVPMEVGLIPLKSGEPFMARLTKEARKRDGDKRWGKAWRQGLSAEGRSFFPMK